jgi:hypothetical protein
MELGDLVQYQEQRWLVVRFERETRLMTLQNWVGSNVELPREFDQTNPEGLQVVANPMSKWPMLISQVKSVSAGPFVRIYDPRPNGERERDLEPMVDWVPSDLGRSGGSFFVNPKARLLPGDLLLGTHKNGSVVRILVPKTFGTVTQRQAMAIKAKPVVRPYTRFRKLLDDEEE